MHDVAVNARYARLGIDRFVKNRFDDSRFVKKKV